MIFFSLKIASPCCGYRAPPCDVGQSHSPINLKSLKAGGRGGNDGVGVFLRVVCACVVCCVVHEVMLVKLVFRLLHRWFDRFETKFLT